MSGQASAFLPTPLGALPLRILLLALLGACTRSDPAVSHDRAVPRAAPANANSAGTAPSAAAPGLASAEPAPSSSLAFVSVAAQSRVLFGALAEPQNTSPFGISGSHNSLKALTPWLPQMRAAGVTWLRGFNTSTAQERLLEVKSAGVNAVGILIWSPPGKPLTFPVGDLDAWRSHVTKLVSAHRKQVRHWEIWNEPPNFTADKSPASYAKVVVAAHEAAKAVDPAIQVGLAAQSVNVAFLESAIDAGARGHFDFLTVHPYETLGLVAKGGEAMFLAIVPTLRAMLQVHDPDRVNVPVLFTELGQPVTKEFTEIDQAVTIVKAYTLSIAQGVEHIFWFEGKDGDSGPFGLLDAQGNKRRSYFALSALTTALGTNPEYLGWVHREPGTYGFVFRDRERNRHALVAWAPPGLSGTLTFEQEVTTKDPIFGGEGRTRQVALTNTPMLVQGVPEAYVTEAKGNRSRPFPWNGDYSKAERVSLEAPNEERGLHAFYEAPVRWFGGKPARDASAKSAHAFTVDPNFALYRTPPLRLTVVLRRNGNGSAGFNLKYESTSGWKNAGWYTVPESDGFVTKEWVLEDAEFSGKWGFHFSFDSDSTANSGYSVQRVTLSKFE